MSFKDYLRIVRRHFLLIGAILVGTVLTFYVYQSRTTLLYVSMTEMALKHPPNFVILTAMNPAAINTLSYEAQLNLLDTPDVLKKAMGIARQKNAHRPLPYLDPNPNVGWEGLRGMMQIDSVDKTEIVHLSITSESPSFSQLMANSVAEAFKYFLEVESRKIAERTLDYIQKEREILRKELDQKTLALRQTDKTAYLQDLLSAGSREMEEWKRLKQDLSQAQGELAQVTVELDKTRGILKGGDFDRFLPETYKLPQTVVNLKQEKAQLEQKLMELLQTKTDLYPEVVQTRAQIAAETREIARSEKEALAQARLNAKLSVLDQMTRGIQKKKELETEVQELTKKVGQQYALVSGEIFQEFPFRAQSLDSISFFKKFYRLKLDEQEKEKEIRMGLQMIQTNLNQLSDREKDLEIQSQMRGEIVEIIRPAGLGTVTNQPGSRDWVLAVIVGLILGLTGAYFLEYLTTAVRTEEDVRKYSNLETIGVIPYMKDTPLAVDGSSYTPIFEIYNMIATLVESRSVQKDAKSLLITSSRVGQGKSVVTLNIGAALARGGIKTIVLDGDLRKANLHNLLGVNPSYRLTDYFMESDETAIPWDRLLTATSVPGLSLVAASVVHDNPLPLWKLERCKNLFKELRQRADVILVDTPPLYFAADPLVLVKYVDSILLVLASGDVDKDELKYTKHVLESVGGNIMGVILNKSRVESRSYYYYYYKKYPYYYNRSEHGYKKLKEL